MTINYPNGVRFKNKQLVTNTSIRKEKKEISFSNRGMSLEDDINETNEYYLVHQKAVIHKKPTPIQIVRVDYPKRSAACIKEAYFKQSSTTDYNGVYKGRYIDFEAKETKNTTSFPLQNFHEHQILHMKNVLAHDGICFVIIRFSSHEETYLLEGKKLITFWDRMKDGGRKSITKQEIQEEALAIPLNYQPRIDYLTIIEDLYFK